SLPQRRYLHEAIGVRLPSRPPVCGNREQNCTIATAKRFVRSCNSFTFSRRDFTPLIANSLNRLMSNLFLLVNRRALQFFFFWAITFVLSASLLARQDIFTVTDFDGRCRHNSTTWLSRAVFESSCSHETRSY